MLDVRRFVLVAPLLKRFDPLIIRTVLTGRSDLPLRECQFKIGEMPTFKVVGEISRREAYFASFGRESQIRYLRSFASIGQRDQA